MFNKLDAVERRYEELNKLISDPAIISNQSEWSKMMKEHSDIEEVVLKYREYKKVKSNMEYIGYSGIEVGNTSKTSKSVIICNDKNLKEQLKINFIIALFLLFIS